jgi:hypothetical protein
MQKYRIKITGSGAVESIREALQTLSNSILDADIESSSTFEDDILFTEIIEDGEVDETPLSDRVFEAWEIHSRTPLSTFFGNAEYPVVDSTFTGLRDLLYDLMHSVDHEIKYIEQMNVGQTLDVDYNPDFTIKRIK